jgi:DNA-binding protein YbaB
MIFQLTLIQDKHGQIAIQLKILEIKVTVEVVGHLELLRLSVTESVLLVDKDIVSEFLLKIY